MKYYTKGLLIIIALVFLAYLYLPKIELMPEVVSIAKEDVHEDNFSGSTILISGDSNLVVTAQKYVDETISDFKLRADKDVPELKAQFGEDVTIAKYSIDFTGEYIESDTTKSVVISIYTYTGGANGMSSYKVFTASKEDEHIMSLNEIISDETSFTNLVKEKLLSWIPEGMDQPVVFADEIANLSMKDFSNWSLSNKNLTIYFDKYQIGPGALGPVPFKIPIEEIISF